MSNFSVLIITAPPPGQSGESSGPWVKIDGREVLLRSVELFLNRDEIKQIQVAVSDDLLEEAKRKYGPHFSFTGVKMFGAGPKWLDQFAAAGQRIAPEATHVIVHDAARAAVPYSDIDALLEASQKGDAIALTAPVRNGLIELDEGGGPMALHRPNQFVSLLTPLIFSRAKFLELAGSGPGPAKEIHPSQLKLITGSSLNIRAGSAADAGLVKAMLNLLPKAKIKPPSSPFEEAQW